MADKPKFDENKYRQQYKQEHFDHFSFYVPKGIKAQAQAIADKKGIKLSEFSRQAILDAIEKDTQ